MRVRREVAKSAGSAAAWHRLGIALARRGAARAACTAFRQALLLDASNAAAYFGLGKLLIDYGRVDEALLAFARAEALGVVGEVPGIAAPGRPR